jgi:hypothetical protein
VNRQFIHSSGVMGEGYVFESEVVYVWIVKELSGPWFQPFGGVPGGRIVFSVRVTEFFVMPAGPRAFAVMITSYQISPSTRLWPPRNSGHFWGGNLFRNSRPHGCLERLCGPPGPAPPVSGDCNLAGCGAKGERPRLAGRVYTRGPAQGQGEWMAAPGQRASPLPACNACLSPRLSARPSSRASSPSCAAVATRGVRAGRPARADCHGARARGGAGRRAGLAARGFLPAGDFSLAQRGGAVILAAVAVAGLPV